ncbi:hypothetical protein BDFB_005582 [Asbolus verrucosus]|uniref:Uncharacterized protein n=1 Tax=Asbolus verrucosus TaxID=1661398 RepID=A0A482WBH4_ASBVE|nr:hypothetical protein BDFB_005582 [Asbolus verrucosus]
MYKILMHKFKWRTNRNLRNRFVREDF